MKKTILKAAVASALIVPSMVMAEATLYGNIHVSINDFDTADNLDMTSNTSAIGVKGSEDLGDGMKAIYKAEFQLDASDGGFTNTDTNSVNDPANPDADALGNVNTSSSTSNGNALTQRDVWAGLKGGMGTLKFGTMSSNYKQMGGKVDPMYRTRLEGRGFLGIQSSELHGGRGITRGRQTNTVQYSSPKMGGIQLVANTTVSGADDETNGVGVRYKTKEILAYLDWIDNSASGDAVKIGGKFGTKAFSVGLQYETSEDVADNEADYLFLSARFNIDKNNAIALTAGQASFTDAAGNEADTTGVAVAYNHKLSKMTNVYVGYGDRTDDDVVGGVAGGDESLFTVGIKKKF